MIYQMMNYTVELVYVLLILNDESNSIRTACLYQMMNYTVELVYVLLIPNDIPNDELYSRTSIRTAYTE